MEWVLGVREREKSERQRAYPRHHNVKNTAAIARKGGPTTDINSLRWSSSISSALRPYVLIVNKVVPVRNSKS